MNIVEALKLAKEQGKKVRPIGEDWFVEFNKKANTYIKKRKDSDIGTTALTIRHTLKDWKFVWEKPSKQTQHKIDSMKFQIVRYCNNTECYNCERELRRKCTDKIQVDGGYYPADNTLDDWSLKDIVEAYHILKKAGEI